ncbi:MAG TPA: hypothetical protein DCM40_02745, partial [Maribacter sp.]|nr:hypothetical protein [Maribacter sp.]
FCKAAISGSGLSKGLHAEKDNETVTIFAFGGLHNNNKGIDAVSGEFIDGVTIGPVASSSAGVKFTGGQDANLAYFDWSGKSTPYYRYAMHNFLAEVPNFFLTSKALKTNLTNFRSSRESTWGNFDKDKKYYMG